MKRILAVIIVTSLAFSDISCVEEKTQSQTKPESNKSSWAKAGIALSAALAAAALYMAGSQAQEYSSQKRHASTIDQNFNILANTIDDKLKEFGYAEDTLDYAEAMGMMAFQVYECISPQGRDKAVQGYQQAKNQGPYTIISLFPHNTAQMIYEKIQELWKVNSEQTNTSVKTILVQLVDALAKDELTNKSYDSWSGKQLKGEHDRLSMDIAKINKFEYGKYLDLYKNTYEQGGAYFRHYPKHQGK